MPRHGGTSDRTRKHRKRRGRNRQSWMDRGKPGAVTPKKRS